MNKLIKIFLVSLISLLLCHLLIMKGLHPVFSSSLIGFLFSLMSFLSFELRSSAYCASFAAIGLDNLSSHMIVYKVTLLCLLISIMLYTLESHFKGWGGKLGTIAFISTGLTLIVFGSF